MKKISFTLLAIGAILVCIIVFDFVTQGSVAHALPVGYHNIMTAIWPTLTAVLVLIFAGVLYISGDKE